MSVDMYSLFVDTMKNGPVFSAENISNIIFLAMGVAEKSKLPGPEKKQLVIDMLNRYLDSLRLDGKLDPEKALMLKLLIDTSADRMIDLLVDVYKGVVSLVSKEEGCACCFPKSQKLEEKK